MDAEALIGSIIGGALTGRRKRGGGALRYLTGGRGSFLNASTLLTVAGVAWGLYESAQNRPTASGAPQPAGGHVAPALPVPPSLPAASGAAPEPVGGSIPSELHRLVQLTLSAARADGVLSSAERDAILVHARSVGAEALVADELNRVRPIREIVAGATDPALRSDLYTLAFSIVRADEAVSGAERIYLAQLASELGLAADQCARLEETAASGIDAAAGAAG